MTQMELGLDY